MVITIIMQRSQLLLTDAWVSCWCLLLVSAGANCLLVPYRKVQHLPAHVIQAACQRLKMRAVVCLLCCCLSCQTRLERAGAAAFVALLELKSRDS
jgi:hypothetical protein